MIGTWILWGLAVLGGLTLFGLVLGVLRPKQFEEED